MHQLQCPQVGFEAMPEQHVFGREHGEQVSLHLSYTHLHPLHVFCCDSTEPCVIVHNWVLRHNERLIAGFASKVDHGDSGELVAHRGVAHLAVQGKHFAHLLSFVNGGHKALHVCPVHCVGDMIG